MGGLAVTGGFGLYLTKFAHYDATYGALGGVVALLTWIYLSSYVFLFGAELNSEVEHQTAHDTTAGVAAPMGERGAWSADHVADGPGDEGKEAEAGKDSPLSDQPRTLPRPANHAYLASRIASRGGRLAGLAEVSAISSVLSTVGLSLLSRRGRAGAGAALIATAAGLALLRREPPDQAAESSR